MACSLCIWIEILKIKYIEYTANNYLTLSALTCSWPYLLAFHGHYSFSFLLNECKTDIIWEMEQEGAIGWPLHIRAQSQSSYGLAFSGNRIVLFHSSVCTLSLSRVWLFATPWTVACQAPLSMGIFQARILEWVAMPFSRGSSQSREWTRVSQIAGKLFTLRATRKAFSEVYCWFIHKQFISYLPFINSIELISTRK